jgi:Cdc6-like AAA superfamily ATPase
VAERQQAAMARHFNPYISGEPVRQPAMFFGRDELLRRIFNALHQNSIMIHGERRMGKTTLLYQLADQLRQTDDPEWVFIPVYMDLEGTSQVRFFYALIETIWGALQAYILVNPPDLHFVTARPEAYSDREFTADLRLIIEGVKETVAPRKVRVILLLDEMDVVSTYDTVVQQQLRRIFMSPLAVNLGAVVAGIQISKTWDRLESPWYNMFNEIPLEPFTAEQAQELLVEPVRGIYEWHPEALGFVIQQSEGYPHRLQQYALEAVNLMSAAGRQHIALEDVQAAHEIIERAKTI